MCTGAWGRASVLRVPVPSGGRDDVLAALLRRYQPPRARRPIGSAPAKRADRSLGVACRMGENRDGRRHTRPHRPPGRGVRLATTALVPFVGHRVGSRATGFTPQTFAVSPLDCFDQITARLQVLQSHVDGISTMWPPMPESASRSNRAVRQAQHRREQIPDCPGETAVGGGVAPDHAVRAAEIVGAAMDASGGQAHGPLVLSDRDKKTPRSGVRLRLGGNNLGGPTKPLSQRGVTDPPSEGHLRREHRGDSTAPISRGASGPDAPRELLVPGRPGRPCREWLRPGADSWR